MTKTIIVKKSNIKMSVIQIDDVDTYVTENQLIEIEPINEILTFKTSDYFEEQVPEQLPDDIKMALQNSSNMVSE